MIINTKTKSGKQFLFFSAMDFIKFHINENIENRNYLQTRRSTRSFNKSLVSQELFTGKTFHSNEKFEYEIDAYIVGLYTDAYNW